MTEVRLNSNDKLKLKADIKISMILGLLFSMLLIIFVGLISGIFFIFGKQPLGGLLTRGLILIGLLFIPFLAISWINVIKYIDLKRGKKLIFTTGNYKIVDKKDTLYILTHDHNNQRIKIDKGLAFFIELPRPLRMEISNLSKSVLFISHDDDNLLDKLYDDKKV
jgi:hypothetical protein